MAQGVRVTASLFASLVLALGAMLALAEEDPAPPEAALAAGALVVQLGDDSFPVREAAARELRRRGLAVKAALEAGTKEPDLEVRLRCRELLQSALRGDLEARLAAFISGEGTSSSFPGWQQFRKHCGHERSARELFAELVRHEAPLLEALEGESPSLNDTFVARVRALQEFYYSGNREQVPAASVAALLLVGTNPNVRIDVQTGMTMHNFLVQSPSAAALAEGPQAETLRGLLEAWVARGTHEMLGYYNLQLALRYNLKSAGLDLARKILGTPGASTNALQNAALAVGRYGDKSDRSRLEPLLKNSTVCHTWSTPKVPNALVKTEIRDVALVMLLRLTEQEPKDYGFSLLEPSTMTVYQIYSFGFADNTDREAALARWTAWSTAQK